MYGVVLVKIWSRSTIVEIAIVLLILAGGVYALEGRIPRWREKKKFSQPVLANFDSVDLFDALKSLLNQTDGTVTIALCSELAHSKVSLHTAGSVSLGQALNKIVTQVPAKYFPYGMLDRPVAHPIILCRGRNDTVVMIEKDVTHK
jgi:hypothetical protein